MSAKSMFLRLTRRFKGNNDTADAMAWLIEPSDAPTYAKPDAASIPMPIRQAEPGEIRTMDDTAIMPPVRDDSGDISVMRWQPTDEDVTTWALRNIRRLSPETLAAGLRAYVQQHPVTA
jgi:hypothetical protein